MKGKIVVLAAFSAVVASAETVSLWDGGAVPKAAETAGRCRRRRS